MQHFNDHMSPNWRWELPDLDLAAASVERSWATRRRWSRLIAWWCGLSLVLVPAVGRANIGPLTSGGQVVAEPAGIEHISISHESLLIDLRPLEENRPGKVLVVYHVENRDEPRQLDLLFATGGPDITGFVATFDGLPLRSRPMVDVAIPPAWQPPKTTPAPGGREPLSYLGFGSRKTIPLALSVTIPSGMHTLQVEYSASAAMHRLGQPTIYHQFAYVLAPARTWAGFGGLDVAIQLPPGWNAACEPALSREGDVLSGSFATIPQDAIAVTVQAPAGPYYQVARDASFTGYLLTPCLGLFGCWLAGRRTGQSIARSHSQPGPRFWTRSLLAGVLVGLVTFGAGLLAVFAPDELLPAGQINHFGYGQLLYLVGVVYLSLLMVVAGFTVTQISARRSWRRARSSSTAPAGSSEIPIH